MKHLIIDSNKQILQRSTYHIIPFKLDRESPKITDCQVSNYFESTIQTQINDQSNKEELTATIQGHKLVGHKLESIDGLYQCLCYKKQETNDLEIIATQKISHITEWRKDIGWKQNEGHIGSTIMYHQIMDVLHSNQSEMEQQLLNQQKPQNKEEVNQQIII